MRYFKRVLLPYASAEHLQYHRNRDLLIDAPSKSMLIARNRKNERNTKQHLYSHMLAVLRRPPVQQMGCNEERKATLECYRSSRGYSAGDVVFMCQQSVRDLDKCAVLMREASLAKISSGSFFTS